MTFENPTPLRVGMSGTLGGDRYRVAGRVVMGMEEDGVTYHWNEYHLVDDRGASSTLVYEETEAGGQWRLFYLFDPEVPMSAGEAASRRVGDTVEINGMSMRVTLVDESRVDHVEGQAPEGVEVGDVARYFNAEGGNQMTVVSWTGDEVECYRGMDLTPAAVATAFRLPAFTPVPSFQPQAASGPASAKRVIGSAAAFLAIVIAAASWLSSRDHRLPPGPVKPKLPPAPLAVEKLGTLNGAKVRIEGHSVVEIAQVNALFDRHEYHLMDEQGNRWLLVCGLLPGGKSGFLFTPFAPENPLTPYQAAAIRGGGTVNLDGIPARVTDLCRVLVGRTEGRDLAYPASGNEFYDFTARSGTNLFLVRWNAKGIAFYRGRPLPAAEVLSAFPRGPEN